MAAVRLAILRILKESRKRRGFGFLCAIRNSCVQFSVLALDFGFAYKNPETDTRIPKRTPDFENGCPLFETDTRIPKQTPDFENGRPL